MGRFLYYLPGVAAVDKARKRLTELGLDSAIETASFSHVVVRDGPDKKNGGIVISHGERADGKPAARYYPDKQTWIDNSTFWIGYYTDAIPTPRDLERPEYADSYPLITDADQRWRAPIAREAISGGTRLPKVPKLSADGSELVYRVCPKYEAICVRAGDFFDRWISSPETADILDCVEGGRVAAFRLAADALGVNYYLGPWELSALANTPFGFTDRDLRHVLEALIDVPMLVEINKTLESKKNEPGESADSTDSSTESATEPTAQPTAR